MELSNIIPHIEALIFASDKPLSSDDIVELINTALGFIEDQASIDQIETAIEAISEKYASDFYAFEVIQSGGGWQFLTKKEFHKTIAQLNGDKFLKKLSVAALETLSIIAYKQPVTKSEMELIRGVNCDYAVQKLLEKDLVVISGRKEDAPGKPLIYNTSKSFMDYFGINSSEDLPKIREVLDQEIIEATQIEQQQDTGKESAPNNPELLQAGPDDKTEKSVAIEGINIIEAEVILPRQPENDLEKENTAQQPAKEIEEEDQEETEISLESPLTDESSE